MKNYGSVGTYVSATGPIDLPRPKRRQHRPARQRHVCPDCTLPLVRPGAFHVCLDLSKPEVVVVVKAKKVKQRKAATSKPRQARRAAGPVLCCYGCGASVSKPGNGCRPCRASARKSLSDETEAEICRLYVDEEWSIVTLAQHFASSENTIAKALDRHSIQRRPRKGVGGPKAGIRIPAEAIDEMAELYAAGEKVPQIAALYGLSERSIYKALKMRGAVQPVTGRVFADRRRFTPAQEAEIAAKYRAGASAKGLANEYGASQPTIRAVLIRQEVELRGPGRRAA